MNTPDQNRVLQELHFRGRLSDAELARAKAAIAAGVAFDDPLTEKVFQGELFLLDRDWEQERKQYQVRFKQTRFLPTKSASILIGLVTVGAGIVWTVGVSTAHDRMGGFDGWPVLGVIFCLFWLAYSGYCYWCANQYEIASGAYQRRREAIVARYLFTEKKPVTHSE